MSWLVRFQYEDEDCAFEGQDFGSIAREVLETVQDPSAMCYLEVSQISEESKEAFKKALLQIHEREGSEIRLQALRKEATRKMDYELRSALAEIERQKEFLNPKGLRNLVESKKSSLLYWCFYYAEPLKSELKEKYTALLEKAIYGEPAS